MKVIIAGSRKLTNRFLVPLAIEDSKFEISEVVSGGAAGIDTSGEKWAKGKNIPVTRFLPDWKKHGPAAGPIRNREMIDYLLTADRAGVILIWDGKSKGSADLRKRAIKAGLHFHEFVVNWDSGGVDYSLKWNKDTLTYDKVLLRK